jgi:hypothetical protein
MRTLCGGVGLEIIERAWQRGFLGRQVSPGSPVVSPELWKTGYMRWIPFYAEGIKLLMDEMTAAAGVEVRLLTSLVDVMRDGSRIDKLVLHSREGLFAVAGRCFVDCTGDANLTALAGLPWEMGDEQGRTMPGTLCSHFANVDFARYAAFAQAGGFGQAMEKALNDGAFTVWDKHVPGAFFVGESWGFLNAGHVFGVRGLDSRDLTRGMVRGRQLAQEFMAFYRKYVPGFENAAHIDTAPMLGVRETRRIVGEHVLSADDFLACATFPDEIGRYNNPIDIHIMSPDKDAFEDYHRTYTKSHKLPPGKSYGIPYRALIPKGSANLLVAGRCMSTDRLVQGSTRVMPCCFITGHAAGAAAALCCRSGVAPLEIDAQELRRVLREQKAYVP